MRRIIFFLLTGLIVFSAYTNDIFKNEDEFREFFTYYYLNLRTEKVIPSLNYYVTSALYKKDNSRMSMAHFYAYILKTDTSLLNRLFDNQSRFGTSDSKIFTFNILLITNNYTSKNLIKKAKKSWIDTSVQFNITKMQNASIYDVLRSTPQSAADLDNLWGVFFATGSEEAVKRIISVLYLQEEGHGMEIIIGGVAEWSLTSNATQHKKVFDIIKTEAKKSMGATKKLLEEIITRVKQTTQRSGL